MCAGFKWASGAAADDRAEVTLEVVRKVLRLFSARFRKLVER